MEENIYIVAGNSADTDKYWYRIYRDIKNAGMKTYCINPKTEMVDTDRMYPCFQDLPEKGTILILVANPDTSAKLVEQAVDLGYKEIWFQPGAYSEEAAAKAQHAGIEVHDDCFMLASGLW